MQAMLRRAKYEQLKTGEYLASIPGFDDLSVVGPTVEDARNSLRDALDNWIIVRAAASNRLPSIDGVSVSEFPRKIKTNH
jgi:predicted RNase H-like HicB family nuclease